MANTKAHGDLGKAELQRKLDAINEQGFRGDPIDPTPNSAYTVAGVTAGEPTPETDTDLAKEAAEASGTSTEQRAESLGDHSGG